MRDCVGEGRGRCGRENGRVLERGGELCERERRGVCGKEEGSVGGRREEGSVWDNEEEFVERRRGAYGTEEGEVWKGERRVWDRGGGEYMGGTKGKCRRENWEEACCGGGACGM